MTQVTLLFQTLLLTPLYMATRAQLINEEDEEFMSDDATPT